MFTKEDILARLQNGETADDIANEMATALNEATAEKEALDAELAAKEKEETRILNAKRAAVDNILDALCDYLIAAGEGEYVKDVAEVKTDKVIEMLDGSIEMAKSLEKLKDLQFPMFGMDGPVAKPKVHKIVVDADAEDADKVIGDFLKNLGL